MYLCFFEGVFGSWQRPPKDMGSIASWEAVVWWVKPPTTTKPLNNKYPPLPHNFCGIIYYMKEEWKEYENSGYFVSNYGEIKRRLHNGRWRFLSIKSTDRYGYPKISFPVEGKQRTTSIHRLVAELFIPNPDNKPQVNHINGDKTNNKASNLEWVTAQENMRHCYTELHNRVTKPVVRVSTDYREFKLYPSISEAAEENDVGCKEIRTACESFYLGGKMYKSGGYYWHLIQG